MNPIPGPKSQSLMEARLKHVARGPFHTAPIFIRKAHGAVLEDVDGNELIDFAAGIGVTNIGHSESSVVQAISEQAGLLIHGSFNVTPYENYIRLAEKLNLKTPGNFHKKTFLANSGAEAVENAIKIARAYTGRQAVICFDHAFHGRTYMAMSLTAKAKPYKQGFGPFCSEIYRAPFPYTYRFKETPGLKPLEREALCVEECIAQFKNLVLTQIGATQVAAVMIEPVLGEGGFIPAPQSFLSALRSFCSEHGIVLIADEIQTGLGRTGTLFASEQLDFVPDLILTAKGLGGGMPISAVTGKAEIMDAPIEGGIGGTFGGNPVSCAAALAVFELFESGELLSRARSLGEVLRIRLGDWFQKFPVIGETRGLGPMHCYENGLIVMNAGTYGNVLRLLMPLVIEKGQLEKGLGILEKGLGTL